MSKLKRREFIKSSGIITATFLTGTAYSNVNQSNPEDKSPSILDAIMNRRSVRHYKPTPVPQQNIQLILEAASMAPTAGNQQPWKFIITQDQNTIMKLKNECISSSIDRFKNKKDVSKEQIEEKTLKTKEYYDKCFSAPVYITLLTDKESKYPSYNHWDGPLAAANLMIAARAFGYGTVHYTDSVPSAITKQVLNIPDRYERVCFTPIGIPVSWPDTPQKKKLESFIVKDSF